MAYVIAVVFFASMGLLLWPKLARPTLIPPVLPSQLPPFSSFSQIADRLQAREANERGLKPGAEACVVFANPEQPKKTDVCYLYLHGLSASRQEISPVTETLAEQDRANAVYARIAGHGMGTAGMGKFHAGHWLESVWEYWLMARALGEQVVIVATSTGAASAAWLTQQGVAEHIKAILLVAPNFGVSDRRAFLLTWPGARIWIPWVAGRYHSWEPMNELQGRYWSTTYSTQAWIEMQVLLEQVDHIDYGQLTVPVMMQVSPDDPVINPRRARTVFAQWGAPQKDFRWITVPLGESQHVFVGNVMGSDRNEEVIQNFRAFLNGL
ncbi:alpha/beta hydrolase [Salinispirillum marinum]|uniref:Alpha/beta hydrolase n=2 Tax=Saccharospirillaceae TaxID=255527 RepID=A0ABV8B8U8_9GAMM